MLKKRIYEISFDHERKLIKVLLKNFFSKTKEYEVAYEAAKLEVHNGTSVLRWVRKSMTIYILKNKMEVCEVNNWKDGFTYDSLNQLCNTAMEISLDYKAV